jgi:hypothetical protein
MREDLEKLINGAARAVHRRFSHWVDKEDLHQELWVWVLKNESYIDKLSANTLKRRLYGKAEVYARKEKAVRSGYHSDDEQFYSIAVLRELLPWAVDQDLPFPTADVNDRETAGARRSAAGPSMDTETMVADVRKAYSGLTDVDRVILQKYVSHGLELGEDVSAVLRRMQRALGGRKPWREAA